MEQSVLNNVVEEFCKCCTEAWLSITANSASSTTLYTENVVGVHDWEKATGPYYAWEFFKPGGSSVAIGEVSGPITIANGDRIRVKYVDNKGCTHYSNVTTLNNL